MVPLTVDTEKVKAMATKLGLKMIQIGFFEPSEGMYKSQETQEGTLQRHSLQPISPQILTRFLMPHAPPVPLPRSSLGSNSVRTPTQDARVVKNIPTVDSTKYMNRMSYESKQAQSEL